MKTKNCTRASFNKTPTNYVSEKSLISVLYDKNTISAMFSFRNCQEAVRRETTEGSSISKMTTVGLIDRSIPQKSRNLTGFD